MKEEETKQEQTDPSALVGQLVRIKCFGIDKKTGMRTPRILTGTLVKADDVMLVLKEPDKPGSPPRLGRTYAIQGGCVDACEALEHLGEIKAEALRGLCGLVLSHKDGSVCEFRRQFNGTFRAEFANRILYCAKGEDLLCEVQALGYQLTSWWWENK
jgi:hypothetical protein